jgi:hypothetical protein
MKTLSVILEWIALAVVAVIICTMIALAAHGQELPNAPSRHMGEFYAAWSYYGAAMVADGLVSHKWAGTGQHPCGWEGNSMFARPNGTFKTGKYFAVNVPLFVGLGAVNYIIRKKAPNNWATRLFTVAFPLGQGTHHAVNVIGWARLCG